MTAIPQQAIKFSKTLRFFLEVPQRNMVIDIEEQRESILIKTSFRWLSDSAHIEDLDFHFKSYEHVCPKLKHNVQEIWYSDPVIYLSDGADVKRVPIFDDQLNYGDFEQFDKKLVVHEPESAANVLNYQAEWPPPSINEPPRQHERPYNMMAKFGKYCSMAYYMLHAEQTAAMNNLKTADNTAVTYAEKLKKTCS